MDRHVRSLSDQTNQADGCTDPRKRGTASGFESHRMHDEALRGTVSSKQVVGIFCFELHDDQTSCSTVRIPLRGAKPGATVIPTWLIVPGTRVAGNKQTRRWKTSNSIRERVNECSELNTRGTLHS